MYDVNRRVFLPNTTVKQLIEKLNNYPPEAKIAICGDSYCYIHVEQDDLVVNIDNEDLDECYE